MSKEKKEKMVDQSTKVIRTASQHQVRQSCDDEEEDQDDYFDEETEDESSPTNIASLLRMWNVEAALLRYVYLYLFELREYCGNS